MVHVLLLESDEHLEPPYLRWPLRLAAAGAKEVVVLVQAKRGEGESLCTIELRPGADQGGDSWARRTAELLHEALDQDLGVDGWVPEGTEAPEAAEGVVTEETRLPVGARRLIARDFPEAVRKAVEAVDPERLVLVRSDLDKDDPDVAAKRLQVLRHTGCEIVIVRPGEAGEASEPGRGQLVPCARGPHCQAALKMASELDGAFGEPVTALYVEPAVGLDAALVGRRILDKIVLRALSDKADDVQRHVVVDTRAHRGILAAAEEREPGLILLGASKSSGLSRRLAGTVPQKVVRGAPQPSVALVRAAVPIAGRWFRRIEGRLRSFVPQLEREARLSLVERVQSNSHWDFDFVTLMALSTLIAALGLMDNSPAVIIGAMLVAPLMTPLLGVGLALMQGNPVLLRMAMRSIVLGFFTSYAIGAGVGLLKPDFDVATSEMVARDWPKLLDLWVAFVAGLAAAYASSRPSLLAALPGVAIAAALVPPVATAGLATACGEFDLALGAALLFLVNMIAIVLASSVALWAVGLRDFREGSRWTRFGGAAFVVAAVLLAVDLALVPHRFQPRVRAPKALVERVEELLGERGYELTHVRVQEDDGEARVDLQVIGASPPSRVLAEELGGLAHEVLGESARVRIDAVLRIETGPEPNAEAP